MPAASARARCLSARVRSCSSCSRSSGVLDEAAIELRYAALDPVLDERGWRRFAAAEARSAGWGGVSALSRITGMAGEVWRNCGARRRMSRRVEFAGLAAGGRNSRPAIPRCLMICANWQNQPRAVIHKRHCCGPARGCGLAESGFTGLATMRWPACCANSATACKPIARPGKAATTPTATRHSAISTHRRVMRWWRVSWQGNRLNVMRSVG